MVTVVVTGCHVPQELVFASAMLEAADVVVRAARRILNVWFGYYAICWSRLDVEQSLSVE